MTESDPTALADRNAKDVIRRAGIGARINGLYLGDEEAIVRHLANVARLPPERRERVQQRAAELVETVRRTRVSASGVEAFLQQYNLASREGVILMCLAEALLRIPDAGTADRLIADKIPAGAWAEHLGDSDSLEHSARRLAGQMATCQQASLLLRFAPPQVADAFCSTRLGGDYNGTLGTLPKGTDLDFLVERALPKVS